MFIFHYFLVNIEDVNDNAPVYEQTEYRRVVRIGDDAFQPPLVVKATDKDGPLQVKNYIIQNCFYLQRACLHKKNDKN